MSKDPDYNFLDYRKRTIPASDTPYVSIQKRGVFTFNRAARALLGPTDAPTRVRLRYDPDNRVIGFRVTDATDPDGYPLRVQKSHGATWVVAGQAFLRYHHIPMGDESRRYVARVIEGPTLIVDLNSAAK